jgi:hypothetical protein
MPRGTSPPHLMWVHRDTGQHGSGLAGGGPFCCPMDCQPAPWGWPALIQSHKVRAPTSSARHVIAMACARSSARQRIDGGIHGSSGRCSSRFRAQSDRGHSWRWWPYIGAPPGRGHMGHAIQHLHIGSGCGWRASCTGVQRASAAVWGDTGYRPRATARCCGKHRRHLTLVSKVKRAAAPAHASHRETPVRAQPTLGAPPRGGRTHAAAQASHGDMGGGRHLSDRGRHRHGPRVPYGGGPRGRPLGLRPRWSQDPS